MKQYYLHDGNDQKGPFEFEELKNMKIMPESMIWHSELSEWTEAKNIIELKDLIVQIPPAFKKPKNTNDQSKTNENKAEKDFISSIESKIPNKEGKKLFKTLLIVFAIIGAIFIATIIIPTFFELSNSDIKNNLELKEITIKSYNPNYYAGDNKPMKYFIEGQLINNSKDEVYKDVVLKIDFFTSTKTLLETKECTIYRRFSPLTPENKYNNYFKFEYNEKPPVDCNLDFTKFEITDAKVAEKEKASQ